MDGQLSRQEMIDLLISKIGKEKDFNRRSRFMNELYRQEQLLAEEQRSQSLDRPSLFSSSNDNDVLAITEMLRRGVANPMPVQYEDHNFLVPLNDAQITNNRFEETLRSVRNQGATVPIEREDLIRDSLLFMERQRAVEEEERRSKAEKARDRLNKPPGGRGMCGGKLSAPELKGLLDASYDSKVKKVGDFEMDKQLSSSTSKVYRNPVTGQVVVAHRGTAGFTDWGNNAVYALGGKEAYKLTPRFKEAEKVQRRAEKKYGAQNVSTIGHSQGGLQSELLGGRSKEIITLNKATLPFESNKNKNQYDIRSERDVVSGLNPFAKKSKRDVKIKAKTYNPLTEHSGDVLNRLGKKRIIGRGPKKASSKDEMEFYGSFGKDDGTGVLDRYVPPVEREIRGQIELHYDGTPAGYFRVRQLKQRLFEMLVYNGYKAPEDYNDFMATFYPEPDMGSPQDKLKLKGPNKKETPQSSAKSDKSSMSYGSEGDQFNLEDEFSGAGLKSRKRVYLKGLIRMGRNI
jgi:hypothetical protein